MAALSITEFMLRDQILLLSFYQAWLSNNAILHHLFFFYHRWPHGVFHLQSGLCHLLLCSVLLLAIYCHAAGLHPHLRLPEDEAEEDRLRTGERESAARLHPSFSGELFITVSTIVLAYVLKWVIIFWPIKIFLALLTLFWVSNIQAMKSLWSRAPNS